MITVKLPSGETVQFPDGTSQEVMKQALAKRFGTAKPVTPGGDARKAMVAEYEASPKKTSAAKAFMGSLLPGLTFGFADEIGAGIGSLFEDRPYAEILAGLRAQQDKNRADQPFASFAGELTGGVPGGFGAAKAAAAGVKSAVPALADLLFRRGLPAASARAGLGGAGLGGLHGYGSGVGGGRMESAGLGALLGAGVGTAAPALAAGAQKATQLGIDALGGFLGPVGAGGRANRALDTTMQHAGVTLDDLTAALQAAKADGQGVFTTADALGSAGQKALSGAVRVPGAARNVATDFMTKRQDGQARRIGPMVADALGAPRAAAATEATMTEAMRKTAKDAYGAAASTAGPVDVRPAVGILSETVSKMSGSGMAPPRVVKEFEALRAKLAGQTAKGEPTTLSDYESVLALWREVKDDIDKAYRGGDGSLGEALKPVRDALEESLSGASDGFRAANAKYRTDKSVIAQIGEGRAGASNRVRSADTGAAFEKLTPDQRAAFRTGYSDPVLARIENAAPGVNKARPLMDDGSTADFVAMAKDPALLQRQLGRERTMFETAAAALGGSKTADNLQDIAETTRFDTGLIGNLVTGRWPTAAAQILPGLAGKNEATRDLIARALLSDNPMRALEGAVRAGAVSDARRKGLAALLTAGQRAGTGAGVQ